MGIDRGVAAVLVAAGLSAAGPALSTEVVRAGTAVTAADDVSATEALVTTRRTAWTSVWSRFAHRSFWNADIEAWVGFRPEARTVVRSLVRMDVTPVAGRHVLSATLRITETDSRSCRARPVQVWEIGPISPDTTWRDQPRWRRLLDTRDVARGHDASGCPAGGVEFDVTATVADAAARHRGDVTFGLRAQDEHDPLAWKAFDNAPVLTVAYNTVPDAPTELSTGASTECVTGDARPFLSTPTPTLSARLADSEGAVAGRFEWWNAAGEKVGEAMTPTAASGSRFTTTIREGDFGHDSVLAWRVRGEDGIDVGEWSPFCEFRVDSVPPDRAPIVSSPDYPEGSFSGGPGVAGQFTFDPDGVPDVVAYEYTLVGGPVSQRVPASQLGGPATATVTPTISGPLTLSVVSIDRAGNRGPQADYRFLVSR